MPASVFCKHCGFASANDAQFCQACGAAVSLSSTPVSIPVAYTAPVTRFAGFWVRVPAALVDWLLLLAVFFPIRLVLGSAVTAIGMDAQYSVHELMLVGRWVRIVTAVLLALIYRAGMESSIYQGTLGKMAMRLKVTDVEGRRISFGRAVARILSKWLSLFSLGIGYLMVAFDGEKRGLHDRIAGTLVLRKSPLQRT